MESKKVLFVADLGLEASIFEGVVGGVFNFELPAKLYFFWGGVQSFKGGGWHVHIMFVRILSHWSDQIYAQHIDLCRKNTKKKSIFLDYLEYSNQFFCQRFIFSLSKPHLQSASHLLWMREV